MAKFRSKIKIFKFGTKNALFGYFRAGILKDYVPSSLSSLKILRKNKNA